MGDDAYVSEYIAFKGPAYVYQIPPARTSAGHRAEDWNVNKWLSEVTCKVITRTNDTAVVKLEDQATGELFAESPLPKDGPVSLAVETVNDSSRYFVLRVFDAVSGRHAFLGIGFRDRDLAQDFRGSLFEFEKAVQRSKTAAKMASAGPEDEDGVDRIGIKTQDFSLKEGSSIKVNLNLGSKKADGFGPARAAGGAGPSGTGTGTGFPAFGLPPPPAAGGAAGTAGPAPAAVALAPPPIPVKLSPPPAVAGGGGLRLAPPPPSPNTRPALVAPGVTPAPAAQLVAPPPPLPAKPLPPPPPQPDFVADFGDFKS